MTWFSLLSAFLVCISFADELALLSDEFDTPNSLADWQRLNEVEGWNADQLELWDADTSTTGHMRMIPYTSAWFMDLRGVLAFKEVTGDFIVTAKLTVLSRHNAADPTEPPNRGFSLAGIFAHAPRNITSAAPSPVTTEVVWPPTDFGSDWLPDTDNYVFLSFGTAGNAGTRQYEVKTTRNGNSDLYFNSIGIPDSADANSIILQMVRVGGTILVLRKHPGGEWIVENRYPNATQAAPIWGETVQVGITAYTDWPNVRDFYNSGDHPSQFHHNYQVLNRPEDRPDLIADIDYVRFTTPDVSLTEEVLQGLATSYPDHNTPALPANIPLGDAANIPLGAFEGSALDYALGSTDHSLETPNPTTLLVPLNPNGTAAAIALETSTTLDSWTTIATRDSGTRAWVSTLDGTEMNLAEDGSSLTLSLPELAQRFYRVRVIIP